MKHAALEARKIRKEAWIAMYRDLFRQVYGKSATEKEIEWDVERRYAILKAQERTK